VRARAATGEPLFVSAFGPAAGLVGLPVAAAGQALGAQPRNPYDVYLLARITAALLTAGSVAMVFLTALGFTTQGRALLLAGAYALGSCVWTLSSQALWQQTSELFFLSVGALFMVRGERAWLRGAATGLAFALAAACRPTAALVALAAACYLLMSDRRAFAADLLAALPVALSLLAYNLYYFGVVLEFGQLAAAAEVARIKTGSSDLWQTPLWLGAAGLLLSPSRGLLVYTPFLAAAFAGAALAWKEERYARLRVLTVAIAALWLPAFAWFDWWGGWTYGYRPIVDSAPLLAMLCAPAIDRILSSQVWKAALAAALAWSVFIQVLGVLAYTPWQWNARSLDAAGTLANIDFPQYRYRLWSVQDSQIAYLIGNFESARAARSDAVAR
jgi:hypothetical protein